MMGVIQGKYVQDNVMDYIAAEQDEDTVYSL